jgi:hypothetical protein
MKNAEWRMKDFPISSFCILHSTFYIPLPAAQPDDHAHWKL